MARDHVIASFNLEGSAPERGRRGRGSRRRALLPPLCCLGLVLLAATSSAAAEPGRDVPVWDSLYRLDRLPAFRQSVSVGMVSSYDRSGGNDDGFSGKYSVVRKEANGLVIADLQGPGVIHRIWTPTPSDDPLEFYFDGETEPRFSIGFRDLFLGRQAPFVKPLVGNGVGGFFSYVPIPFARACKISVRGERVQFVQINYSLYAEGARLESFRPRLAPEQQEQLDRAAALFAAAGTDVSRWAAPPEAELVMSRTSVSLQPGTTALVYESQAPGRIVGLRFAPAAALAGKARDVVLKITFDGGRPSVLCPVGDFFGFAWGEPATRSLLVGVAGDAAYCHFPMPFARSARVELVSEAAAGAPLELHAEVVWAPVGRRDDEGLFHAVWRRENPTAGGRPFTFLDVAGRGHFVGAILQAQGVESGKTLFFEGDDETWIDGQLAVHGTGSEDFFNGGWYDVPDRWEKRLSFPLSGCLGYQKHLGRTGGYRLLLGDAYPFGQGLRQTIEHSGTNNDIPTDYCAVSYFYADPLAAGVVSLPPAGERAVVDPAEVIFPAWWQVPIRAWTFQEATLGRGRIKLGEEEVRFLSLRAKEQDWFGPPFLYLSLDLPADGAYEIQVVALKGPEGGRLQLFRDEVPVGEPVGLYAAEPQKSGRLALGTLELRQGANEIMLKLVGKPQAAAALGLDLVEIVCSAVPRAEEGQK